MASATVALACWGRCVSEFNSEVASIVETVNLAGTGAAVRDLSVEDIVAIRSAARRDGEARWHTAFDKHIVTGRDTVRRVLQEGPGEDLILELFQAGYLPMSIVNLFPGLDFAGVDWAVLSANLRARGISEDTLPAFQELLRDDPERAQETISSDVGDRIDGFRLHHRIDDLLWHYATDWGVDVDQYPPTLEAGRDHLLAAAAEFGLDPTPIEQWYEQASGDRPVEAPSTVRTPWLTTTVGYLNLQLQGRYAPPVDTPESDRMVVHYSFTWQASPSS